MEYEETPHFTPRGSTKLKVPGAKVAANLKRRFSTRLSRTISSERAPGSDASNDNAETPRSKRFSLRHRRSKSRVKKEDEKAMAPRRSFSVDDLSKLVPEDVDRQPIVPLETEVKVPPMEETEDGTHELAPDAEGLLPVPPETPVPEQRPFEIRDNRSNSNISMDIPEVKEIISEDPPMAVDATEAKEAVKAVEAVEAVDVVDPTSEIEVQRVGTFELSPDADATIDAGIEETVLASLTSQEPIEKPEEEIKVEPEHKTLEDVHAVVVQSMEGKEADEKPKEVQTQSRAVDLEDLIPPETEEADQVVDRSKTPKKEAAKKPRRRRFARIIKPASFSLATLAVGLLLIILKKH